MDVFDIEETINWLSEHGGGAFFLEGGAGVEVRVPLGSNSDPYVSSFVGDINQDIYQSFLEAVDAVAAKLHDAIREQNKEVMGRAVDTWKDCIVSHSRGHICGPLKRANEQDVQAILRREEVFDYSITLGDATLFFNLDDIDKVHEEQKAIRLKI